MRNTLTITFSGLDGFMLEDSESLKFSYFIFSSDEFIISSGETDVFSLWNSTVYSIKTIRMSNLGNFCLKTVVLILCRLKCLFLKQTNFGAT